MIPFIQTIDLRIILFIEKHLNHESIQVFFSLITKLNDYGLLTILAVLLIINLYKDSQVTKICLYSILISLIIVQLLGKNIIQRPRPFEILSQLTLWIEKPTTYSFPSGHASISGIGFMLSYLYLNEKIIKFTFMALFILVTVSRLVLKVHFFSDIFFGFFIAIIIVLMVQYIILKRLSKEA
ncbi:MAG TPA: phosphatase PAP2 family protein [Clostridia bacterium]|nr:phosphatase PAP2 family protein [Clostridia bacterium]